jgi:hypothetical protein
MVTFCMVAEREGQLGAFLRQVKYLGEVDGAACALERGGSSSSGAGSAITAGHTPRSLLKGTGKGISYGGEDSEDSDDGDVEQTGKGKGKGKAKGKGEDGGTFGTFGDLSKLLSLWVEIHGHHPYNTKCLELSSAIPHTEWLRVIKLVQVKPRDFLCSALC